MPAPATSSRHLYTGHRQDHTQVASWLRTRARRAFVPGLNTHPGFDAIVQNFDASAVVHTRSSSRRSPDLLVAGLSRSRFPPRLLTDMTLRRFGLSACTANPEDLPPSLAQHGFMLATFYIAPTLPSGHTCSILFHFEVPGGRWQTVILRPVDSASPASSVFHSLVR